MVAVVAVVEVRQPIEHNAAAIERYRITCLRIKRMKQDIEALERLAASLKQQAYPEKKT